MLLHILIFSFVATLSFAQPRSGQRENREGHPKFLWSSCHSNGTCSQIPGEIVLDSSWRWLRLNHTYRDCYSSNDWYSEACNSTANCTANCVVEGAPASTYKTFYGIDTNNGSNMISQKYATSESGFGYIYNSRVYLLESANRYQTFTLLNNEIAFDVDVKTLGCGLNGALQFVAMDADGGISRFSSEENTNKDGPEYGQGYCNARCTNELLYVGGKANYDGWKPSETISDAGSGYRGACCPQVSVWNSNSRSYSMSTHPCPFDGYEICEGHFCDPEYVAPNQTRKARCDPWGCSYNPYQLGQKDFYGVNKTVNTWKNITVVTRFSPTGVTQFFIQDNKRIDPPSPIWKGFPEMTESSSSVLSEEFCRAQPQVFGAKHDLFAENGGWKRHLEILSRPMVLSLSIADNLPHRYQNNWLDGELEGTGKPGDIRGECKFDDPQMWYPRGDNRNAKVIWRNIRFGPVGSTVKL